MDKKRVTLFSLALLSFDNFNDIHVASNIKYMVWLMKLLNL